MNNFQRIVLLGLSAVVVLSAQNAPTLSAIGVGGIPFAQGTVVQVSLVGSHFVFPATVTVSNPGVTGTNVIVEVGTKMLATLSISASGPLGSSVPKDESRIL